MIAIADIVQRLKDQCPELVHVDHALTSAADFPKPAALVAPVKAMTGQPALLGVHSQMVVTTFGVYLILDRRQNGATDAGVADDYDAIIASIRSALAGWVPDNVDGAAVAFAGGELAPFSAGPAVWRDDYSIITELRI